MWPTEMLVKILIFDSFLVPFLRLLKYAYSLGAYQKPNYAHIIRILQEIGGVNPEEHIKIEEQELSRESQK